MTDVETVTFSIAGPDGDDEFSVPADLIGILAEEDDESMAQVVGDLAMLSFAGRAHAIVHHNEGEPSEQLAAVEAETNERFEERFGVSYAEATGHSH